jgi:hypothetical protein
LFRRAVSCFSFTRKLLLFIFTPTMIQQMVENFWVSKAELRVLYIVFQICVCFAGWPL